jgi:hypothetical protein
MLLYQETQESITNSGRARRVVKIVSLTKFLNMGLGITFEGENFY